jgi:ATP-dependent protease HslVU (ClpYQ) peptidase subunit
MNLKEQKEIVKKVAIDQVKELQKKKKLTRLEFTQLLAKKGYKLSIQAYYDFLAGRLSTDTTINNATKILKLVK